MKYWVEWWGACGIYGHSGSFEISAKDVEAGYDKAKIKAKAGFLKAHPNVKGEIDIKINITKI